MMLRNVFALEIVTNTLASFVEEKASSICNRVQVQKAETAGAAIVAVTCLRRRSRSGRMHKRGGFVLTGHELKAERLGRSLHRTCSIRR